MCLVGVCACVCGAEALKQVKFMLICGDVHELNPEASVPYHCSHRIYMIGKCVCVCAQKCVFVWGCFSESVL